MDLNNHFNNIFFAALWERKQTERMKEIAANVVKSKTSPSPDFTSDLVTLSQAAVYIHRTKGALEKYKGKGLPLPDIKGGKGKAHLWKWSTIRPFLLRFRPDLPETFPGNRR